MQAVAKAATSTGARSLMSQWQRQAALAAAQKGLTSATMRYSAVQSALSFLGPVMWAWLAVDLVKAAVGTDYARVVRAVYILAQVNAAAAARDGAQHSCSLALGRPLLQQLLLYTRCDCCVWAGVIWVAVAAGLCVVGGVSDGCRTGMAVTL